MGRFEVGHDPFIRPKVITEQVTVTMSKRERELIRLLAKYEYNNNLSKCLRSLAMKRVEELGLVSDSIVDLAGDELISLE